MSRAVLSLGSNVGDRLGYLQLAVEVLREHVVAVSPVVQTPPWGPVAQPDFLNAVLLVDDRGVGEPGALDWLHRAQAAELQAGRTRHLRWGPRTLDVDVVSVWCGGLELGSADPALILPHPRAAQRAFVLLPWLAVDPEATLGGRRIAELLGELDQGGIRGRPELVLR